MSRETKPSSKNTAGAKRRATATRKLRLAWGAERVFLAWIRTAIALMALGFLIARLGGLLRILGVAQNDSQMSPLEAIVAGIALMALGGIISVLATWRFKTAHTQIMRGKVFHHSARLSVLVGVLTALVCLGLVASLCIVAFGR